MSKVKAFQMESTDSVSSLAFYRRIFPVQQLKLLLLIATGIVLCYLVGSVLTAIFQW